MRRRASIVALAWLLGTSPAAAWQYDDARNYLAISGTACRGEDGSTERLLRHYPGSTSVVPWADTVRVFCPLNRRNLHAYDERLSGFGETVDLHIVSVKVHSPSGDLRCRLFAKQRFRPVVMYSDWQRPLTAWFGTPITPEYIILFPNSDEPWETLNWGVMCDVPRGEAIKSIAATVENNNG